MNAARACALLIALSLALTGCSPLVNDADIPQEFTLYASFYPIYALAALIVDSDIPGMTLNQLIQPQDGCLRLYTLSDWDAYMLMRADAVILGGNGLEAFANALTGLGEDGPAVIQALSGLTLSGDAGSESHMYGVNPWLFLSVTGAMDIAEAICVNMIALDAPYEQQYRENLDDARSRLSELRSRMLSALEGCDMATPVALAHEGLEYFAKDMGLSVYTRVDRESGVDTSGQELTDMLAALDAFGAEAVLIERQAPDALVNTLELYGYRVCKLDTLSTGSEALGADGYFDAMCSNALALRAALNGDI